MMRYHPLTATRPFDRMSEDINRPRRRAQN